MRAGQSEVHRRVIERRRGPGNCGMALRAVGGEVCRYVIGIRRALKIFQVATNAGRAGQVVNVVGVTVDALPRGYSVSACQWESYRRVIELRTHPTVNAVAAFAGGGKLCRDVVWSHSLLEIRRVAGIASRRHRLELAVGCTLMAGIAVYRGVCSGQREAVGVLLNLLERYLPPAHGMALLAIRSQLPLVYVRMAVLASLSNVGEHRLHVTLHAGHRLVHPAQRVFGLIVIEFREGANRLPSRRRVAVLTRHVQTSVRTVCT